MTLRRRGVGHLGPWFRHRRRLAIRVAAAVEINDTLVQRAAMAKWALEAGDVERALAILEETVDVGQRLVTALINGGPPAGDRVQSESKRSLDEVGVFAIWHERF
jgi:hypothetical protein